MTNMRPIASLIVAVSLTLALVSGGYPQTGSQELHIKVEGLTVGRPQDHPDGQVALLPRRFEEIGRTHHASPLPRPPRQPDAYTTDQWVIRAIDPHGREVYHAQVPAPMIRAEFPADGETHGELSERHLFLAETSFLVPLPDQPLARLDVYQPTWTGERWQLSWLGVVHLKGAAQ